MLHGGHTRSRPRERQSKNASPTFCEGIWGIRGRSSLRVVDILLRPHHAGGREPPCSWNGGQAILPLLSSDSSSTKWDGSYLTGPRADGTVQCVRSPPPPFLGPCRRFAVSLFPLWGEDSVPRPRGCLPGEGADPRLWVPGTPPPPPPPLPA